MSCHRNPGKITSMSTWQRLCEEEQRQMHEVVASSAVMLNDTLEDADVDMGELEELEGCLAASVL